MGERFTLDVDSFQRLLAAAWALQCECDRKIAEDCKDAHAFVQFGHKVNRIPANFPIPSYIFEVDSRPSQSQASNVGPESPVGLSPCQAVPTPLETQKLRVDEVPVLRPKSAASVSLQPDICGTLALAPERSDISETSAIPFLLDELKEESAWEKVERIVSGAALQVVAGLLKWREELRSTLRVKVIIRGRAKDDLTRYAAPVFAVLVVGVMLIPQISSRVGWLRSVKAAAHLPASIVGTGSAGQMLETSHLRITDARNLAVLDQMSRYEVRNMRRQAEFGDDTVALTLGMAYETGRGVPQNCKEAAHWVELAAEDGNAAAQYNLGLRYLSGDGVREDRAEARKWIEAASQHGYARASVVLQSSGF